MPAEGTTTIVIRSVWSRSTREEVICALWSIAAVAAYSADLTAWSWAFGLKAASDAICSIVLAVIDKESST